MEWQDLRWLQALAKLDQASAPAKQNVMWLVWETGYLDASRYWGTCMEAHSGENAALSYRDIPGCDDVPIAESEGLACKLSNPKISDIGI